MRLKNDARGLAARDLRAQRLISPQRNPNSLTLLSGVRHSAGACKMGGRPAQRAQLCAALVALVSIELAAGQTEVPVTFRHALLGRAPRGERGWTPVDTF